MGWADEAEAAAPGSPGAYRQLASTFRETADEAADIRTKLAAIGTSVGDGIWRGPAADAFRDEIKKLPDQLAQLHTSYDMARSAMSTYATELEGLKGRAGRTAIEGGNADSAHANAAANRQQFLNEMQQQQAATPDVPVVYSTSAHDSAVDAARRRIEAARRELHNIKEEREDAERRACETLDEASERGIHNESWLKRALRSTLRVLSAILENIAIVLTVIAVIIVIVVLLSNPFGWAALVAAFSAAAWAFTAATAVTLARVGVDAIRKGALDDESVKSWTNLGIDAGLALLPNALGRAGGALSSMRVAQVAMIQRTVVATTTTTRIEQSFTSSGSIITRISSLRTLSITSETFHVFQIRPPVINLAKLDVVAGGAADFTLGVKDMLGRVWGITNGEGVTAGAAATTHSSSW